jgi:tyrosine-protein kinase Etk/Wzc
MEIANALGKVYVEHNQKLNQEEAKKAKEFIESQISQTGRELSKAEATLEKQINIAKLARSTRVSEQIYIDLLRKLGEARISEAVQLSNVRVIEPASLPTSPIKPRKAVNAMLALIFGGMVGLGLAFLFEYMDDSIGAVDELSTLMKLPVLGAIPRVGNKGKGERGRGRKIMRKLKRFGQRFNIKPLADMPEPKGRGGDIKELVVLEEPRSPAAEAFRVIRTNIQFVKPDEKIKSIGITSAGPMEGKTLFVSNLAVTIAQTGKKVLLVDCDLRKPRIHKLFGLPNQKGATSYLAGGMPLAEVIQKSKVENLSIMTSGPIPPNPAELIGSNRFKAFLKEQSEKFDVVLFDAPPVMSATDAALLGSRIDGMLLVVDSLSAVKQGVLRAKQLLNAAQAKILGVVLQKVSRESRGYYYHYYRYYDYYYHDYHDEGKDAERKNKN